MRRGGRDRVGCIVLGRGEDDVKVRQWLKTAAAVPGFIGFAVGRTSFWDPLVDWKDGQKSARGRGRRDRPPLSRVVRHLRVGRRRQSLIPARAMSSPPNPACTGRVWNAPRSREFRSAPFEATLLRTGPASAGGPTRRA